MAASLSDDRPESSLNLANEVQSLLSALSDPAEDFVQSVCVRLRRSPMIVLYTQEQMDDLRLLCTHESPSHLRSVLYVDTTFNLSSIFVAVMAYKNRKVVERTSQEPPIFIGPIMLRWPRTCISSRPLLGLWTVLPLHQLSSHVMVW